VAVNLTVAFGACRLRPRRWAVQKARTYVVGGDVKTNPTAPKNVDEYIAGFPRDIQEILQRVR